MYQRYWGFQQAPFAAQGIRAFRSDIQQEALARVDFLVSHHRRVGLLTGPNGVGKTALLDHLTATHQRRGMPAAMINALGMDGEEFLLTLCASLGMEFESPTPLLAWRGLLDHFLTYQYQNQDTLIAIDDVHEAELDVLQVLARLAQWQPGQTSRITLVCGCRSDRVALVGERLTELADLPIALAAWDVEDTSEFIRSEMQRVGCSRVVFEHEAIETIHELSEGVARLICRLGELVLIAGAAHEVDRVDAGLVHAVSQEFQVVPVG